MNKHKLLRIQLTIQEAQRLLRYLYERHDMTDKDLVEEIESALDDAAIEDEPTIDE